MENNKKKSYQQVKLLVGIRHSRGVDTWNGLSGEAHRGDSTPFKPLLESGLLNLECHVRCVPRYESSHY